MATAESTIQASSPRNASWRDRFRVTRVGIFSMIVMLIAAALLFFVMPRIEPDAVTRLTFGGGIQLDVVVVSYLTIVVAIYMLSGVVGLLPIELNRVKFGLLLLCGVLIFPTILIIAAAGNSTNATSMLASSLRLATPIVLGALAGIWCERSGVVNIAIEGMMLTGACFGFLAFSVLTTGGMASSLALVIGVVVGVLSGGLMAMLHGWLSITFKTDQIVSGTVINILALGLTSFLRREVLLDYADAGRDTLQPIAIPGLSNIPVVGEVLFTGKPIFYLMFILLFVTHIVLFYTRWGLRTRAVGENPHAADTLGINVQHNRWINVFIGGLIAGLAGAWLTLETTGTFDDGMTSGRGFIALAAMIFGKWMPFGALAGALVFGFSSALETRFQILGVQIPSQFLQMTPYLVTIIVLAGLVGKATAPKADGVPYEKE